MFKCLNFYLISISNFKPKLGVILILLISISEMVLIMIYIVGIIACVVLNLLVVVSLLRKQEKLNYLDMFIASLSISDILKAVVGFSFEINSTTINTTSTTTPCVIAGFTITFLGIMCFKIHMMRKSDTKIPNHDLKL